MTKDGECMKIYNTGQLEYISKNIDTWKKSPVFSSYFEELKEQDELILPGLGVFFELVWENADQELKNQIIEIIRKRVRKGLDSK